jgi:hypothetical protein
MASGGIAVGVGVGVCVLVGVGVRVGVGVKVGIRVAVADADVEMAEQGVFSLALVGALMQKSDVVRLLRDQVRPVSI